MIDINGNYKSNFNFPKIDTPLKALAKGNFLSNISIFYKQDLIKKIRYDETPILIGVEDYDFLIQAIGHADHLGRIETVLAGLREHPNRSVHLEESEKTVKRIDFFYKKNIRKDEGYMYPFSRLFKAYLDLYLCSFYVVRNSFGKAFSYLFKSIIDYPRIIISKDSGIVLPQFLKNLFTHYLVCERRNENFINYWGYRIFRSKTGQRITSFIFNYNFKLKIDRSKQ
jgi:hypothetical protein